MADNKSFKLNGQTFEIVAQAQDKSYAQLGDIIIYRAVGDAQHFMSMPKDELRSRLQSAQPIDWGKRIELYKKRFVGRTDVYAKRYFNKFHKKAYSPAGPFENGHPSKTVHYALSDDVLLKHLKDEDFAIGIYPIAQENTTPFLAIDIDGHHDNQPWEQLTNSFRKVCKKFGVPELTELSQSGKGCHIWIFFTQPISAAKARSLGDALLQATQSIDPRLPFTAFDRLFPAQDQTGGTQLGNLIAAPLEGQSVKNNKGVFVNENLTPLKNQWQALSNVESLSESQTESITSKIRERTGFRLYDSTDSNVVDLFAEDSQVISRLTVLRANALYIQKAGLNKQQILKLKWLASFYNPQFFQAQANRLSVYKIPRIITLFKESETYLILPRGLGEKLSEFVEKIDWQDKLIKGSKLHVKFNGKLRPNQVPAYTAMAASTMGILAARTGFGKTVIAARLIASNAVSTLILVKNKTLAEQWRVRLNELLTITDEPIIQELTPTGRKRHKNIIGTYYGTKKNISGLVDIATIQSLSKLPKQREFLSNYGMVISDEVHHDAAFTFDEVISHVQSQYLYGLSATPYRRDGQEPIITMRFGPIRYQTDAIDPEYAVSLTRNVIPRFTNFSMTNLEVLQNGIVENREALMNDPSRDAMILRDCKTILKEGRHAMVLTNLVAHVDQLYAQLPKDRTFRIYGGFSSKERALETTKINDCKSGFVILATTQTGGEGLDIAALDTMILAMPISYHGNVEQYVGRLHRNLKNKSELRIYDYVDMFVPMMIRMYRKRKSAYKHLGYQVIEDEFSRQKGLKVYEGHYQESIVLAGKTAKHILIMTPKLKSFLKQLIQEVVAQGGTVDVLSQSIEEGLPPAIAFHRYEYNLPNCIIIDDKQLWVSADSGFNYNRGIAFRIDHPELIRTFKQMLIQTTRGLPNV